MALFICCENVKNIKCVATKKDDNDIHEPRTGLRLLHICKKKGQESKTTMTTEAATNEDDIMKMEKNII